MTADEMLRDMGFRFGGTSQDGLDLLYTKPYVSFTHVVTIRAKSIYGPMIFSVISKNGFVDSEPIGLTYEEMKAFCRKIEELKGYLDPEIDDGK